MPGNGEYLLLVIPDKKMASYLAHQVLARLGYRIDITHDASTVLQVISQNPPDLIIADLHARGLSGKDLLVALKAQNLDIPIIILSNEVEEGEILQTLRLGATDFILTPAKETEIISVIDRAMQQVHSKHQEQSLQNQLNQLQQEVDLMHNLTATLMELGKSMSSIANQKKLFQKILSSAIQVTQADMGWLLVQEDDTRRLILKACHNTSVELNRSIDRPVADDLSAGVYASGETLKIHGSALQEHPVYHPGREALIVPIKNKVDVLGSLTVIRKQDKPFDPTNQKLLEVIAGFSSLPLVNARLIHAIEQGTLDREQSQYKTNLVPTSLRQYEASLIEALDAIIVLLVEEKTHLAERHLALLKTAQTCIQNILRGIQQPD